MNAQIQIIFVYACTEIKSRQWHGVTVQIKVEWALRPQSLYLISLLFAKISGFTALGMRRIDVNDCGIYG